MGLGNRKPNAESVRYLQPRPGRSRTGWKCCFNPVGTAFNQDNLTLKALANCSPGLLQPCGDRIQSGQPNAESVGEFQPRVVSTLWGTAFNQATLNAESVGEFQPRVVSTLGDRIQSGNALR